MFSLKNKKAFVNVSSTRVLSLCLYSRRRRGFKPCYTTAVFMTWEIVLAVRLCISSPITGATGAAGTEEDRRGTPAIPASSDPPPSTVEPRPTFPVLTYSGSRSPHSGNSLGCFVSTAKPWPRSGSSAATGHRGRHTNARCKNSEGNAHTY